MNAATVLTALAAGLASALLVVYPAGGIAFAHLPLFAAGAGGGAKAAGIAGAAATAVWVALQPSRGWVLGLLYAVPAVVLVALALRHTEAEGRTLWYPADRLAAAAMVCALGAAVLVWIVVADAVADPRMEELFAAQMAAAMASLGQPALPREALTGLVRLTVTLMPGMIGAMFLFVLVANAALAQALMQRLRRALRPAPRIAEIAMPSWAYGLLALAAIGIAMPGLAAMVGAAEPWLAPRLGLTIAMVLSAGFVLGGLAVLHSLAARWTNRRAGLVLAYLGIFAVGPLFLAGVPVLILFLAGLLEPWLRLRERLRAAGPG